jgi:RNA polymerase sigma-70 factor, ECF subfamily
VNDDQGVDHASQLLEMYDSAVRDVYGYLVARCRNRQLAEDLTAETFLAAVGQIHRGAVDQVTVAWLVGIARHKLIDHWRRTTRQVSTRTIDFFDGVSDAGEVVDDPWDAVLDERRVTMVMDRLGAHHRGALTLRYIDGLGVPAVAEHLGRTVHATEALLVRARNAFRAAYQQGEEL